MAVPLGWSFAATTVSMAAVLTPPVFFAVMARDVGLDPALVGAYAAAGGISGMLGSLLGGGLTQRLGPVRVAQVGMGLIGLGLFLLLVPSLLLVAASAMLLGFGYGPANPYTAHVLARHTPASHRALIFSIKQAGVAAGAVLAGWLVPPLVVAFGWRATAGIAGAAVTLLAIASALLRPRYDAEREPGARIFHGNFVGPLRIVLGHARLRELVAVAVSYNVLQSSFTTAVVTYLVDGLGMTLTRAGTVLALANMVGIAGRISWGWVADFSGRPRTTLAGLGFVMAAAGGGVAAFGPDWPYAAVLAVAVVLGATAIGWNGVFLAEIARHAHPSQVARTTGGAASFGFLGGFVGPMTFSAIATATSSYALGYAGVSLVALAGAFLCLRPRAGAR